MPQAIAAALIKIGLSATLAAIASQVIITAAAIGISSLVNSIFAPPRPRPSDGQLPSNESIGSRYRHYGIVHTSGKRTFFESREGTLAQVLTLGTGHEGTILEHRLSDKPVTLDAGGFVTQASYKGAVSIHTRSGSDSQLAISQLTDLFPEWTADHRQRGCAHAAIIGRPVDQEDYSEVYNGREPTYTQVRKGVGVYDPRQDDTAVIGTDESGDPIYGAGLVRLNDPLTWPWSDNWALVAADYFAHPDGFGAGYDQVNWTNIAAEADVADQTVSTASGETIARWRIWARYSLAGEKRADVFSNMLKAGDGFAWQDAEGKLNLMCGRWVEPDLVITDDYIVALSAAQGPQGFRATRAVKVLYTEAAASYREQESATIGSLETDDDGEAQGVEAFFAPHHNQAARLGKLVLAELDPDRWQINVVLNLLGLDCLGRRFARFESAKLGLSFWVKISTAPKIDLASLRIEVGLAQTEPGDWDFDADTEEGTPPVSAGGSTSTPTIEGISGLVLSYTSLTLGDSSGVAISASWDAPSRRGLSYEAQFRPSGGSFWQAMSVDPLSAPPSATSGPVETGVEYQVRVRSLTIGGRPSVWSEIETITPVASSTLPAPSGLYASGSTGSAEIFFSMPTSPGVDHVRIFGSDSNDFLTAVQIGGNVTAAPGAQTSIEDSGLSAGTRYYWARSFDLAETNPSIIAGPVSADIT